MQQVHLLNSIPKGWDGANTIREQEVSSDGHTYKVITKEREFSWWERGLRVIGGAFAFIFTLGGTLWDRKKITQLFQETKETRVFNIEKSQDFSAKVPVDLPASSGQEVVDLATGFEKIETKGEESFSWSFFDHIRPCLQKMQEEHKDVFIRDLVINNMNFLEQTILEEMKNHKEPVLAFPLAMFGHYTLVVIDRTKQTVEFYNSMPKYMGQDLLAKLLETFTKKNLPGYKFQDKLGKFELQHDAYQCGPWIVYFLENRLKNPDIDFTKNDNPSGTIARYRETKKELYVKNEQ